MNIEKVNLDDLLIGNAIPQFITEIEATWREGTENDKQKQEAQDELGGIEK